MKYGFSFALLTCACLIATRAYAQQPLLLTLSLHAPAAEQTRATDITIDLVILNSASQAMSYQPAETLSGTLRADQKVWIVNLHPANQTTVVSIPANGFVNIPYVLTLPGDTKGRVVLEVSQVPAVQIAIDIHEDLATGSTVESLIETIKQQEANEPPAMSRIERSFTNRFGFHEPMYLLYGLEAPNVKFQFSFKYRLIGEDSKFGELIPPFRGFYFAYTQRSLWDTDADSTPFYDTSYMPELFFEWLAPQVPNTGSGFHWLGLQTGMRHESNGKANPDSRSVNIAYLRTSMAIGSIDGWQLLLTPRLFTYLKTASDNPDMDRYRGYGELQLSFGKNDATQIALSTRLGTHGNKGSIQVDVSQPVRIPVINLETYLQLQFFNGYGESLRTYDQRSSVWRLGLAIVR